MIDLYNINDSRATQRRVTLEKCNAKIGQLRRQQEDIEAQIAELEAFLDTVRAADAAAKL